MGKTVKFQDPGFDKKVYWERRKKGYAGQIPALGSSKQQYEARRAIRLMQREEIKKLGRGKHERTNRKSPAKSV